MDASEPTQDPALPPNIEALHRELERLRVIASKDRDLLAALLDHSPHGIIVCDAQGRLVLQNRASERIWAGSASAPSVQDWKRYRAFHGDGRAFEPEDWAMARCLRTLQVVEAEEIRIRRFDDSPGVLLGSSAPLLGADGALEGGISVFADITRLKEAEERSHRLEHDLERKVLDLEALAGRASRLQNVTAALTRALSIRDIADVILAHGQQLFQSPAAAMFVAREDATALDLVARTGMAAGHSPPPSPLPLRDGDPLELLLRDGEVRCLTRTAAMEVVPGLAELGCNDPAFEWLVLLPLRGTRRALGALVFGFPVQPVLDEVRRDFFLTLAAHCALALERAQLFEAERRAKENLSRQSERLQLLAHAGETLASSLDSREALAELARLVVPTIADWCGVDELAEDGHVRRLAIVHRDPERVALAERLNREYPPDPDAQHGVPRVLRTGELEFVPEIPDAILVATSRDAQHLELARSLRLSSFAVIPIKGRGQVLGALSIVTEGERRLTEDDVRFTLELARRAALALDNARLYESESAARAQLHGLFMRAPAAIAIVRGADRRYELANVPYRAILGEHDLVGRRLGDVSPALGSRPLMDLVRAVYDDHALRTVNELRISAPDAPPSQARYFRAVAQPIRRPSGEFEGVALFAFEITDQVRARTHAEHLLEQLARSEARMRALVEATAAIVWTAQASGTVAEASPSWLTFTGQSEAEYLNRGFLDAIHPDDRAATLELWQRCIAAQSAYSAEYRLRRGDGTYAHTLARARPVRDPSGHIHEYIGCNIDVTELRNAEAQAREHAEILGTINELGKLIAAELDTQKVVQAVTDAATELTGAQFGAFFYNVVDDQGARYLLHTISGVPREHFDQFPLPRATAVFAPTFAGEGVLRVDDITQDPRYGHSAPYYGMPEGHLPVRSYLAVPVVSRSGEVLGGIFLGHGDPGVFTARAETLASGLAAQAAIAMDNARLFGNAQRLIKALEATNRELDQFAYVTSHDLKAPLRGIASLASWIEEDLGPGLTADVRRKLELLQGRVRRMEGLIQGILEYSRAARSTGRTETVDVAKLVTDVAEMFAPSPPARIEVPAVLPTVRAERVALQQIFMNLVGNALKHAQRPDVHVQLEARDAGDHWEFRIADNGPGIAPAFQERIWGIFQTLEARDKVENTGIGLAIVRKIVESHHGRTWVESSEGHGAVFAFTWPKHEDRTH